MLTNESRPCIKLFIMKLSIRLLFSPKMGIAGIILVPSFSSFDKSALGRCLSQECPSNCTTQNEVVGSLRDRCFHICSSPLLQPWNSTLSFENYTNLLQNYINRWSYRMFQCAFNRQRRRVSWPWLRKARLEGSVVWHQIEALRWRDLNCHLGKCIKT